MSIDAQIFKTEETDEGLVLHLMPRDLNNHAGQPALTVVHPTWTPPLDTCIWGNDTYVYVVITPERRYRRIGYTRLEEIPL